jgi:ABC-2 type transport system ATP-binding protein
VAAIEVRGLERRYSGGVLAVAGIDLEVSEGEIYAFLGPNGAGKTTTVRMLVTLLLPTGGTALVAGHDVVREAPAVRRSIGVALQEAALDPLMTGRELMLLQATLHGLSSEEGRRKGDALLDRVGLTQAADRRVGTYSGGMRRRLDLATALVHDPSVLFLDEPTTGLDPQGRNGLWEVIESLVDGGTTVLLTTQYLEEADTLADNIVVIDHGTVIAEGTAADLKARLGATTIEIGFRDDAAATTAVGLLGSVGRIDRDGKFVHLNVPGDDGAGSMLQTVRVLDDARLEPTTLVLREPTLDDVFLSLTGHAAAEGDADGDGAVKTRRNRRRAR